MFSSQTPSCKDSLFWSFSQLAVLLFLVVTDCEFIFSRLSPVSAWAASPGRWAEQLWVLVLLTVGSGNREQSELTAAGLQSLSGPWFVWVSSFTWGPSLFLPPKHWPKHWVGEGRRGSQGFTGQIVPTSMALPNPHQLFLALSCSRVPPHVVTELLVLYSWSVLASCSSQLHLLVCQELLEASSLFKIF